MKEIEDFTQTFGRWIEEAAAVGLISSNNQSGFPQFNKDFLKSKPVVVHILLKQVLHL